MGIETAIIGIGAALTSIMSAGAAAGATFGAIGSAVGAIGAVGAVGGALFAGEQGLQAAFGGDSVYGKGYNTPGTPNYNPALPPTQAAAADTAAAQLTASRRALIASGGETNLTGIGGAPLLGANIMTPGVGAT